MGKSLLKNRIKKILNEALTPDQVSKVEDKYNSIYSGMLKGNKKKLMKYVDPKFKRPNPDAMAMGRAINLVKKDSDKEEVNENEAAFEHNKARAARIMNDLFGSDFQFDYTYKLDGDRILIHPEGYNDDGTLFDMKDTHKEKIIRTFQEKFPSADAKPNMGGGITIHLKESVNENEAPVKVGDKLKMAYQGSTVRDKTGVVTSVSDDMAQVDFGGGDSYGILFSRIKGNEIIKEDKFKGEWPKELTSRYSDEYRFELEKVSPTYQDKPGRAKYRVIDIESGELKATPVFGKPEHLMAYADDLIKPQGGTQSSHFGTNESVNEGYLERAIEKEKDPKKLAKLKAKKEFYDNTPKEKRRKMSDGEIRNQINKSVNEDQESKVKEDTKKALEAWYDKNSPSPSLFDLAKMSNMKIAHVQSILKTNKTATDAMGAMFRGINERLSSMVREVYSEKQRKWACAQDDPKFDEMCKDTAISKKKLKEGIDFKKVASYFGMSWFEFYSKSPKVRKEMVERYKKDNTSLKEERTSTVNKSRAKSELKQMLKGKRDDGMGKSTLKAVLAIDKDGKETEVKKLEDFDKFEKGTKFALKETTMNNDRLTELIKAALKGPVKEDKSKLEEIDKVKWQGELLDKLKIYFKIAYETGLESLGSYDDFEEEFWNRNKDDMLYKLHNLNESYMMDTDSNANTAVLQVLSILKHADIDGETMQYILEELGMDEQMWKQLNVKYGNPTTFSDIREDNLTERIFKKLKK